MLRVIVHVQTLDQLEILLDATKTLGLVPELGSVPLPLPSKRRRGRSTKAKAKAHKGSKPKRWGRNLSVRMGGEERVRGLAPKLLSAHQVLAKKFGNDPFPKGMAKGVIAKRLKTLGASGLVTKLMDTGGLVPA